MPSSFLSKLLRLAFATSLVLLLWPQTSFAQSGRVATLSISPGNGNLTPGSQLTVDVMLDTGGEPVNTVQASLQFNNLTFVSYTPGPAMDSPADYKQTGNTVVISRTRQGDNGFTGTASLVQFKFTANQAGTASIIIDQNNSAVYDATLPSDLSQPNAEILKSVNNGSYNVAAASQTTNPGGNTTATTPTPTPKTSKAPATAKPRATATPAPATSFTPLPTIAPVATPLTTTANEGETIPWLQFLGPALVVIAGLGILVIALIRSKKNDIT